MKPRNIRRHRENTLPRTELSQRLDEQIVQLERGQVSIYIAHGTIEAHALIFAPTRGGCKW